MRSLRSINLRLSEKLRDREYRADFFAGLAQDEIAQQIRTLRKKRGLRQIDIAEATGMKQSAVSRLEKAEYSKWGFSTLLRLAGALDARIRVIFEPVEEVISSYEQMEAEPDRVSMAIDLINRVRDAEAVQAYSQRQKLPAFPPFGPVETQQQQQQQQQAQSESQPLEKKMIERIGYHAPRFS